jgi:hypothetical protein
MKKTTDKKPQILEIRIVKPFRTIFMAVMGYTLAKLLLSPIGLDHIGYLLETTKKTLGL